MTDEDFDAESDILAKDPSPEKIEAFSKRWAGNPYLEMAITAAVQQHVGGIDDWVDLL